MARLPNPRVLVEVLRSGNLRMRLRAARVGQAALRLQLVAAAVDLGVLDVLAAGPMSTAALAERLRVPDADLLAAYLRVLAAAGFVSGAGPWALTRPVGRSSTTTRCGPPTRASAATRPTSTGSCDRCSPAARAAATSRSTAEVIARLSAALGPLLHDLLARTVRERRPRRVLDIGCGAGLHLAAMLEAAPGATGVGVDVDPDAAALARRTLSERGLADRGRVEVVDIRTALAAGRPGALPDRIDLALLANASTTYRSTSGWSC